MAGIDFCPLLKAGCIRERCVWHFIDEGCAILTIARTIDNLEQIAQDVEHISLNGIGPDSYPELKDAN